MMRPLWRALALAWLGGVGSPALMDDCMLDERTGVQVHEQRKAESSQSLDAGAADNRRINQQRSEVETLIGNDVREFDRPDKIPGTDTDGGKNAEWRDGIVVSYGGAG